MDNKQFDERLKICAFRAITARLNEQGLLTQKELQKINRKIDGMEKDLVAAKPKTRHPRNLTVVE